MNIIDIVPFDKLVLIVNSLSNEKSKRILLNKATNVYDNGERLTELYLLSVSAKSGISSKRINSITASHEKIAQLLTDMGYSKQGNQKMEQVSMPSPDHNKQFEFIDHTTHKYLENGEPVISVDTKKKENIGNFKNAGAEYRKQKNPRKVLDHDFPIHELGKVAPYEVYVLNNNTGFVNLGTSHDTSEFAVTSISCCWNAADLHYMWWWEQRFPQPQLKIRITAVDQGYKI